MKAKIYFENEQNIIKLKYKHKNLIKKVIKKTLECEGFKKPSMVSVTVTDNAKIHELNLNARGIDRPTDVLSFPVLEFEDGKIIENAGDVYNGKILLGDIVLSFEKAMEQSIEYGHSFEREVGFLVCHSTLHLLGYDHETEPEREVMRTKEESTLKLLNLVR